MRTHPLAAAMRRAGMTQARLAVLSGVPQSTISRVLSGERPTFSQKAVVKLWPVLRRSGLSDRVSLRALLLPPNVRL